MQKQDKTKASGQLTRLQKQALELARRSLSEKKKITFSKWHTATEVALRNYFGEQSSHYQTFINADLKLEPGPTTEHRTAMRTTAGMLGMLAKEVQQHWSEPNHPQIEIGDFWQIIHPKVVEASQNLFQDGHFAEAVSKALRALEEETKHKADLADQPITGSQIMNKAFSPKEPLLKIPASHEGSAQSIQDGYRSLFAGIMMGVRNPLAHSNLEISREEATHLLFMASHLMGVLDSAKKNQDDSDPPGQEAAP
jgi:uncharacterized protein (TIGR02391 family)